MRTGWQFNELYLWHDTLSFNQLFRPSLTVQPGEHAEHPETKRRFRNLVEVSGLLEQLEPIKAGPADDIALGRFHTEAYLTQLKALSAAEGGEDRPSSPKRPGSFEMSALSAG